MSEGIHWHYFLGKEGNSEYYPRNGCEWFDEKIGKWKPCFESREFLPFLSEFKYRRKVEATKP